MLKRLRKRRPRRPSRTRTLNAERLEDRRLLAVLDLIPGSGTISEEGGVTVVTVDPGTAMTDIAGPAYLKLLERFDSIIADKPEKVVIYDPNESVFIPHLEGSLCAARIQWVHHQ